MIKTVVISLILVATGGCHVETVRSEVITIEGIYYKDIGHPFPGPAVMAAGGYYRLSGDAAQNMQRLGDETRVKVKGKLYTRKRTIPEGGRLREITEHVLEVQSFEVVK